MNFFRAGRISAVRLFIFAIIASALFAACSRTQSKNHEANANSESKEEVINVTTAKAESRQVPSFIQATGTLIADESSDVAPKVAGKVSNVSVNVGQFVTQGSIIAKIDDKDARIRVAEAKADVNQAIAGVRQAEARLGLSPNGSFNASAVPEVRAASATYEQTQSELRQAEVNLQQAEVNEKRYRDLVESGDKSMMEYESYRTTRDVARTARDTARARVNNAKQNLEVAINNAKQNNQAIKSAEAAVESARLQVTTAEQAVADTVIRAPFSGFVSNRPTAVGEFVSTASVIATILRTNPIKIQIQIAEADVPYVGIGRGVSIEVDAYKDRKFGGTVTAVNPALDQTTRSATVEAQIENGNNALRSGMFATAKITRDGGSTGVFVPKAAVLNDESTQNYRVFVIQEGIAKLRTVQLGNEENGFYQILSGVSADETVATNNLEQLFEGAKVVIEG